MGTIENENYKPPHVNEDGLERDETVTDKLVAPGDGTKITFTNSKADGKDRNGDAKIEIQGVESQFVGLSKEELMKYANDPFWVRLRMALFVLFWLLWVAMLVGAVAIIVLTPRCAPPPQLAWWQSSPVYNVEVASFEDSNNDGTGDIEGLISKLSYIKELGMRTLLLRSIFPSTASGAVKDYTTVDPDIGSVSNVEALLNATKELELHVVLEINPAFTSNTHQWFLNSKDGKEGFEDLFVWEGSVEGAAPDGKMADGNSAWTFEPTRSLHYLHQSEMNVADINWKSPQALEQFAAVLRFWLERGISGFLITNTYLGHTPVISNSTFATEDDVLYVLKEWRQILGNYSSTHQTAHRVLGIQVDKTASEASPLYGSAKEPAADLVLSKPFELQPSLSNATSLRQFVQGTLNATSEGMWPSFVLGNALCPSLSIRAGVLLDGLHMVAALVQGTPIFYYGDELGVTCEKKPCRMPWIEGAAETTPGISVEAQTGNSSHLEVVRHSTQLRDKLAVRLGTTVTSVLGGDNSTVFAMLRVRKGTPGYMAVVNGGGQQVTVNLAEASSHVPESGHVEVKSTHSTKVVQSKVKLGELSLDPYEAVILQFVPIFE